MKVEIGVPEVVEIFKEIEKKPERLFEIIRVDVGESVSQYLSELMNKELSHFLVRDPYERKQDSNDHRNGSYDRSFTLKGIGQVKVKVPRDREAKFKSQVIPRSKRYEDSPRQDLCLMFLTGVSTRTL